MLPRIVECSIKHSSILRSFSSFPPQNSSHVKMGFQVTEACLYFPDSIRAKYGRRGETLRNVVHGSDSRENAEREIHFFFPDCKKCFPLPVMFFQYSLLLFQIVHWIGNFFSVIIEPLLREERAEDFLWEAINPVLIEGLTLVKVSLFGISFCSWRRDWTNSALQCCKTKPVDPVLWLANWLILNNPNKPKLREDLALIPT